MRNCGIIIFDLSSRKRGAQGKIVKYRKHPVGFAHHIESCLRQELYLLRKGKDNAEKQGFDHRF